MSTPTLTDARRLAKKLIKRSKRKLTPSDQVEIESMRLPIRVLVCDNGPEFYTSPWLTVAIDVASKTVVAVDIQATAVELDIGGASVWPRSRPEYKGVIERLIGKIDPVMVRALTDESANPFARKATK